MTRLSPHDKAEFRKYVARRPRVPVVRSMAWSLDELEAGTQVPARFAVQHSRQDLQRLERQAERAGPADEAEAVHAPLRVLSVSGSRPTRGRREAPARSSGSHLPIRRDSRLSAVPARRRP